MRRVRCHVSGFSCHKTHVTYFCYFIIFSVQTCKKTTFFSQLWFQPKIFHPKKFINYDKSNLRQNSVKLKGPKYPNSANKMPKSNLQFQNLPKNAIKKRKIATLLTFLTNQRKNFKRFYLR